MAHKSDCSIHNGPALTPGPCTCRAHCNTSDYRADKRIIVYTDKATKDRLREVCKAEGKSQSEIAGRILREALAARLSYRSTTVPTMSLNEAGGERHDGYGIFLHW